MIHEETLAVWRCVKTGPSTVAQVSEATGIPVDSARKTLNRLKKRGKVDVVGMAPAVGVDGEPTGGRAKVWGAINA